MACIQISFPSFIKTSFISLQYHNRCAAQVNPECRLGLNKVHVLPPTSICPTVLDRQRSVSKEKHREKGGSVSSAGQVASGRGAGGLSRSDSLANENIPVREKDRFSLWISLKQK